MWIMLRKTAELACWKDPGNVVRQKRRRRIIPTCIWWTTGRKRNAWSFEDVSNSTEEGLAEEVDSVFDIIGSL